MNHHHHLLFVVDPHHSCAKLVRGAVDSKSRVPYAFHPGLQVLGIGKRCQYSCPRPECQDQMRHLQFLSPHSGVVDELMKLYPQTELSEYCAGYMVYDDKMLKSNEASGHFGQNWNDSHRQTLDEFFQQHLSPVPHIHYC